MTKEIKNIKQAEKEIARLENIIAESQGKIIDLAGYIKYEESLKPSQKTETRMGR